MKTKALIWIGLVLQLGFFLYVLIQAPEPHGAIKIGLERLQADCPSQAAKAAKSADGNWVISTAGDFFSMASNWIGFIVAVTICFTVVNAIIFALLLLTLRGKRKTSNVPSSEIG